MQEHPNLLYVKELANGDEVFESKLLSVIKKELFEEIENYTNCFKNEQFVDAAIIVHKLRNKISILGLYKGSEIAKEHENDLRNGNNSLHLVFLDILENLTQFMHNK
ncbi:Hpt domain-containing protein [Ulvibacter antarcticus]|uniref:HPt domain-containing protein n=1 Tax=Ulvibacter antarcticus TaxID=442714 RepID=A0A3L9Z0M7_9FLAO|nr:Hpt domain-containing protein [Ulvibacter antarcticus]RMA66416.1 hypothetical protein BXY75_0840 [Ulvibacter antarcticus]